MKPEVKIAAILLGALVIALCLFGSLVFVKDQGPDLDVEGVLRAEETVVIVEKDSCVQDIQTREAEVQLRIELAEALIEQRFQSRIQFAKGSVTVFEDGSGYIKGEPNSDFCIPYAACDEVNGERWVPQSLLVDSWTWPEEVVGQ
jgi:hypothetical protein